MADDPYAHLRHLDGKRVLYSSPPELLEDVDGMPLGTDPGEQTWALVCLPPLPEPEE